MGSSANSTATKAEKPESSDQKLDVDKLLDGISQEKKRLEPKKPKQAPKVLSPEEQAKRDQEIEAKRQEAERKKRIKKMHLVFQELYPNYMDGNSIKYPIEDKLIVKMKELHGSENIPQKPESHKVLVSAEEFEDLLYIFEFCNNFMDFLEIPEFKIEDLYVALTFQADSLLPETKEEEEDTWMEEASTI